MDVDAVIDNDVLIKCAAYGLLIEMLDVAVPGGSRFGVLGTARFVVRRRLERSEQVLNRAAALSHWKSFLSLVEQVEPTDDEIALSLKIEEAALRNHEPLDGGESQLCAIAISRHLAHLITGDKRAIGAAESLLPDVQELAALSQRLVCLEQVAAWLVTAIGAASVRAAVCGEPMVDRALGNCFACTTDEPKWRFDPTRLRTYIETLRRSAPTLLMPGP